MTYEVGVSIRIDIVRPARRTAITSDANVQPAEEDAVLIDIANHDRIAAQNRDGNHAFAVDVEAVGMTAGLDIN